MILTDADFKLLKRAARPDDGETTMLNFDLKHPRATHEMLGFLPDFWDERDPRDAKAQAADNYGWSPFQGFTMQSNGIAYPGDPPMQLIAEAKLRDETIRLYQNSWVAIVQPDGSYEISRMD